MKNKEQSRLTKICMASMFMAIGWLMPFLSGQNTELGNMLCLMHIPVLMAGFVLGPEFGLLVGFMTPLTRSFIFGRPGLYPTAVCMAVELAAYGFLSGFLYRRLRSRFSELASIYMALVAAMMGGRVLWGLSRLVCGFISQSAFTMKMFLTAGFVTAIPGMLIQLFLIPALVFALNRSMGHE